MTRICTQKEIRECVLLSTCNRTELYTVSEEDISVRSVMTAMQRIMLDMAGIGDAGEVSEHLRFYQGTQAVRHLFYVAAGLDSMVLGEDQILGQVKEAHRTAMEDGFSGTWCNSLFRMAVTAAKKVKTETKHFRLLFNGYIGGESGGNVILEAWRIERYWLLVPLVKSDRL